MAYYLDSSFDLGVYQPSSTDDLRVDDDEATAFLAPADFDLDSTIFSDPGPVPSRTTGPAGLASSSSSNYTHFPDLGTSIGGASASSPAFALADPGSPFNTGAAPSPYPIRSLTRDGRLKTKLMGVGHDGGFLTSPLIVGKPRVDSRTGRVAAPEIAIDSPVAFAGMAPQSSLMTPCNSLVVSEHAAAAGATSDMTPSMSRGSSSAAFMTGGEQSSSSAHMSASSSRSGPAPSKSVSSEPTGLGMGIIGVPDLQVDTAYEDDAGEAVCSFGMTPAPTTAMGHTGYPHAAASYAATPRHARSVTQSGASQRIVDYNHGPHSPPPFAPPPSASHARPTRALPNRSINKAKSCSALSMSARQQARRGSNAYEPLTPTSAEQPAFPHGLTAPYVQDLTISQIGNSGLLSFADLYNLDGDNLKQQQDPLDIAVGNDGLVVGLHGMPGLAASGVPGLPQQQYGPPSAASSPSTPYLSDPSPDHSHQFQGLDDIASTAMLVASSVESAFSTFSAPAAGRQRTGYAPPHGPYDEEFDPHMLGGQQQQPRQRQLSASALYGQGARNFSYPTRLATQPQQQPQQQQQQEQQQQQQQQWQQQRQQSEQMQWGGSSPGLSHLVPPPMPPVPSTPRHRPHPNPNHQRAHTGPAGPRVVDYAMGPLPPMPQTMFVSGDMQDEYDRKMAEFDSLYSPSMDAQHQNQHQHQGLQPATKRGRDDATTTTRSSQSRRRQTLTRPVRGRSACGRSRLRRASPRVACVPVRAPRAASRPPSSTSRSSARRCRRPCPRSAAPRRPSARRSCRTTRAGASRTATPTATRRRLRPSRTCPARRRCLASRAARSRGTSSSRSTRASRPTRSPTGPRSTSATCASSRGATGRSRARAPSRATSRRTSRTSPLSALTTTGESTPALPSRAGTRLTDHLCFCHPAAPRSSVSTTFAGTSASTRATSRSRVPAARASRVATLWHDTALAASARARCQPTTSPERPLPRLPSRLSPPTHLPACLPFAVSSPCRFVVAFTTSNLAHPRRSCSSCPSPS